MYSFLNDYSEGAHPSVLDALNKTNYQQTVGYGLDPYCKKASDVLKQQLENDQVDIHYLVGGTQTNFIMISFALRDYQAVIAVDSGHINVHETGAVEATGHKILTRPHKNGKLTVPMIDSIIKEHSDEHMVQPKMVYISQTSEYGTYYTLEELKEISTYCRTHQLYLFVDGARLGSALMLKDAPSLKDLATYCDAFYIGGTKMGALFGECLVIVKEELKTDFRYAIKQHGAMLAKGRLLGIQFLTLFQNDLYLEIGRHENKMAQILKDGIQEHGYHFYIDSISNQLFPIFPKKVVEALEKEFIMTKMFDVDEDQMCMRLVTSWNTPQEAVNQFVALLDKITK